MKTPQYIFIHHTAVSYTKNPDQWKATDAYHKGKGWGGGGYNYEVAADGGLHQFRPDGSQTAAQFQQLDAKSKPTYNMNDGRAISICWDGNGDIELPTLLQKAVIAQLIKGKMEAYKIPRSNIFCHRRVAPKTCPGKLLPDNIADYFLGPEVPKVPEWAECAISNAIASGKMSPDFAASADFNKPLSMGQIQDIFQKVGLFKEEGPVTLARLLVALDRLGIFKK